MKDSSGIDEKTLLLQVQRGNQVAFGQLYRHYSRRLTAKLLLLVKSEELAQDLLQEIFCGYGSIVQRLIPTVRLVRGSIR